MEHDGRIQTVTHCEDCGIDTTGNVPIGDHNDGCLTRWCVENFETVKLVLVKDSMKASR